MNEIIRKVKWFWAWQDDKEEAWLGEMARLGLHLKHAGYFGQYTFLQGTPCDVVYRLDFVTNARKSPDYFQLFTDAGWEYAGELGGWQYWRKEVRNGERPEIYTDAESKIHKYQRLLAFMVIFIPIFIVNGINYNNRIIRYQNDIFSIFYEVVFFFTFVVFMLIFFSMLMILRRISQLKRK